MVYPADATAYTGSIFDTLGTETWAASTVTLKSDYRTDLSGDGVAGNNLDARQEQYVAEIVGAMVDELKEYKEGGTIYDMGAGAAFQSSNHPLYYETDGVGGNVDQISLVEEGYMVYLKGQFDVNTTATNANRIVGSILEISTKETSDPFDPSSPTVGGAAGVNGGEVEVTFSTGLDIQTDILPDIV